MINMATLKKGGGQNVGLNFIDSIRRVSPNLGGYHFVVSKDSELEFYLKNMQIKSVTSVSSNPIFRLIWEVFRGNKLIRNEKIYAVYTIFGIGLYPKRIPQISGSADSNIFFPEVDFWEHYRGVERFKKWLIDRFRIYALKRATAIIFENELMLEKSEHLFGIKNKIYIRPSISINWERESLHFEVPENTRVGLFFCGWQKNKNYEIIPYLARDMKNRDISFHFVFTAPKDNSKDHLAFLNTLRNLRVSDMVSIVGPITKMQIKPLYERIDFVFLLSKLESFSNNIIEAWQFKRPLIVSKESWALSICSEAAFYVNRNSVTEIVDSIDYLMQNPKLQELLVENGNNELLLFPSIDKRTKSELNYINEIYTTF